MACIPSTIFASELEDWGEIGALEEHAVINMARKNNKAVFFI